MANKNFIDSNKKTKYGRHDVEFWIGTVVAYASQEEQINEGFGWMYKVRIDGDHSKNEDQVKDEQLSYAYCILPTTAGSGAAFKLRSARISQGDTVFGVRGGGVGAPAFIIGVFPRTRLTKNSSGNFGLLSGFYGSLVKNKTLSGEFNDQIGPETPKVTPIGPKEYSKAEKKDPSEKIEKFGINKDQKEDITEEQTEKLEVKKTKEEWNPNKQEIKDSSKINTPSDSIVTPQIKNLLTNVDDNKKQSIINKINPLKKITKRENTMELSNNYVLNLDYLNDPRPQKSDYTVYKDNGEISMLKSNAAYKKALREWGKRKKEREKTNTTIEKKTKEVYDKEYSDHVVSAIKQGIKQNLLDKDSAQSAINAVRSGNYERANLILFPPGPPTTG